MSFTSLEFHECDDGTRVDVGKDRHGQFMLVFDGPDGYETIIRFDKIQLKRRTIVFRVGDSVFSPRYLEVGEIQRGGLGAVGAWLERFADNQVSA